MNLWHDVSVGKDIPESFNCIIEIPKGSFNKYEIDKETGLIALDRANYSHAPYPFDYGLAPQTLWDDNDALDVILLTTYPLFPGVLVRARPVALMNMVDSGEPDDKLIAVPADDPRWQKVLDLEDINSHTLKELEHFYSTYKQLQGKKVVISGFKGRNEAQTAFTRARELYQKKYQV